MSNAAYQGADVDKLMFILEHQRPHLSPPEEDVIRTLIHPLKNKGKLLRDSFGNYVFDIPLPENWKKVIWSCHTDTVHFAADGPPGPQPVDITKLGIIHIPQKAQKYTSCLGADDGAGMWLMLEMIEAGVPGRYMFHRGEERGCIGSKHIRHNVQEAVQGFDCAIALDRRDYSNIITHQRGVRRCSDDFALSFAKACSWMEQLKPDPTGAFTDTAEYSELVPECTNISVGYEDNHGSRETLNLPYLLAFRQRLLKFDGSILVIQRNPAQERLDREAAARDEAEKTAAFRKKHGYYDRDASTWMKWDEEKQQFVKDDRWSKPAASSGGGRVAIGFQPPASAVQPDPRSLVQKLTSFLNRYPKDVAQMLVRFGFSEKEFLSYMKEAHGKDYTMDRKR